MHFAWRDRVVSIEIYHCLLGKRNSREDGHVCVVFGSPVVLFDMVWSCVLREVLWEALRECYGSVTGNATGVLRECYGSVTGVLRECYGSVTGVLRECSSRIVH